MAENLALVAIIMGSKSDWETMRQADEMLTRFGVVHECRVLSAHRTPIQTAEYVSQAEGRGIEVIVAAAGGAAGGVEVDCAPARGAAASSTQTPQIRRKSCLRVYFMARKIRLSGLQMLARFYDARLSALMTAMVKREMQTKVEEGNLAYLKSRADIQTAAEFK